MNNSTNTLAHTATNLPDISVVVCAYTKKRCDDLIVAITSLQQQTLAPREVILVIDHNRPLLDWAQEKFAALNSVRIIENGEVRGLSGARNSGIAASSGAVVAFMDEDAEASPNWLETLAAHYADANVMGVGGSIHPRWMSSAGKPAWFPEEFNWVVGCTYKGMPEQPAPVRNLIGCNMSLRREVFEVAGAFRKGIGRVGTLPVGCEETELCIRARQKFPEKTIVYDPAVKVINHRVPATRANWHYYFSRCFAEGISKALVAKFVGAGDGLASERTHALKVLPQGVWAGIKDAFKGDLNGLARAFAIVSGFVVAGVGLVYGNLRGATTAQDEFDKRAGNGLPEMA